MWVPKGKSSQGLPVVVFFYGGGWNMGERGELRLYPGKSHTDPIKSLSPTFRGATPALADSVVFLRDNAR